jgi:SET domain-containing protein
MVVVRCLARCDLAWLAWTLFAAARVSCMVLGASSSTSRRPELLQTCFSYQDAIKHDICIQETKTKGLGAFAGSRISAGSWVGEYTGEILTDKQVDARYWDKRKKVYADRQWIKSRTKREQGISGDYLFDMGDNLFLDAEDSDVSSWCRFLNHASEDSESRLCNLETKVSRLVQDGKTIVQPRLWFVALRDVESGEELLYDYGGSYWASDEAGR